MENSNINNLVQWGLEVDIALKLQQAIQNGNNVIICGPVGSGKTKLLNELISHVPKDLKFVYVHQHPISDYSIEERIQSRLGSSIDLRKLQEQRTINENHKLFVEPDYCVIDDLYREQMDEVIMRLNENEVRSTLATVFLRNYNDWEFITEKLICYFDTLIYVERYKEIKAVAFGPTYSDRRRYRF